MYYDNEDALLRNYTFKKERSVQIISVVIIISVVVFIFVTVIAFALINYF